MPNKSKSAASAPAAAPTAEEMEILLCWLSAKRAKRQAEAIMERLAPRVLALATRLPTLTVDGAQLTVRNSTTWSYTPALQRQIGDLALLQKEERDNRLAIPTVTGFVYCQDRKGYDGPAVVAKGKENIFTLLFGKRNKTESAT